MRSSDHARSSKVMNGYWKPFRGIENPLFPRPPEIGSCPDKAVYDYSRDVAVHSDLAFVARLGRDRRLNEAAGAADATRG